MKILYTVAGEGLGHATRSKAVLDHLVKQHDITIISDDRAHDYLKQHFPNVKKIRTLHILYHNNKVSTAGTGLLNICSFPLHLKSLFTLIHLFSSFKPDIIINDFTYQVSYLSKIFGIPMITLDNEHIITDCNIQYPRKYWWDHVKSVLAIKCIVPFCNHHLISTFFYPKKKFSSLTLFGPILRSDILKLKPKEKKYILVYQTSKSNQELIRKLAQLKDHQFIVYGFDGRMSDHPNIIFRNFSEDIFFKDIAECQAVIANGGFVLLSEAIYLEKPVLSVPIRKQFEQILNAHYLEKLGYGEFCEKFSIEQFNKFMKNIKKYKHNLKKFDKKQVNNILPYLNKILRR